jgi:Ni2+-binding GTPase involved in maturation of urease and hydrogenase
VTVEIRDAVHGIQHHHVSTESTPNLAIMETDALRMRAKRSLVFTNLKGGESIDQIASFVIEKGGLAKSAA